ncbi:MAG: hypothetical protein EOO41_00065 [Methanobacteriota archaeon]|nr:MAG: hypothetical protein EOO41_00065 [Euryarchaeota archaeon]
MTYVSLDVGAGLASMLPRAPASAVAAIEAMLAYNPARRPTAAQCLNLPFFKEGAEVRCAAVLCTLATACGGYPPCRSSPRARA